MEAFPDSEALGGWRMKYGYQDINPGKPGVDAATSRLDSNDPEKGLTFSIPIEQNTNPGLRGKLRIEVRPWD